MSVTLSVSAEPGAGEQQVLLRVVTSLDEFEGQYDVLEVWRSRDTEGGPYEELTAETYQHPRLPPGALDAPAVPVVGQLVNIVGDTLSLRLDEEEDIDITFVGADPLSYSDVALQIWMQSLGRVASYVDDNGALVLQYGIPGPGSSLRVLECDAAPKLGLDTVEPGSVDYGNDARIALVMGQTGYSFTDPLGSSEFYYKVRFRNLSTGGLSAFSNVAGPATPLGVSVDSLAIGELDLVTAQGAPLAGQEVRIYSQFNGTIVEGKVMVGSDIVLRTDIKGHVEAKLVRGNRYSVAVHGTDLVRDLVVPADTTVERFNLLDPDVTTGEDVFSVQVPNLVYAERRSL